MFHLFAGNQYYPQSGLGDYRGTFDSVEEAELEGVILQTDWYCVIGTNEDGSLYQEQFWYGIK